VTTWVPACCPVEKCGYVARFQMDKTVDWRGELISVRERLSQEHPDHPGDVEDIVTTEPAADD
jgi:hypothetical protein